MYHHYAFYVSCALTCATLTLVAENQKPSLRQLNNWTSSLWKSKKLGGDTPYTKTTEKESAITCPREPIAYDTFRDWQVACNMLPRFQMRSANRYLTTLDAALFITEIERFFETAQKQLQKIEWVNNNPLTPECADFKTYAEKLIVPDNAVVAIHGDLHGDIHALNRFIQFCTLKGYMDIDNPFKIKDDNFYMLFLGDYVDRGWYGAEVVYTILRLKNENPNRVFMVRGNHEDISLNNSYGFSAELDAKFARKDLANQLHAFYNTLPAVLYLGTKEESSYHCVQCCHGGIELGFNPHPLLATQSNHAGMVLTDLTQETICNHVQSPDLVQFKKYFKNKPIDAINGFMWNDFIVDPQIPFALSPRDGYQGAMFNYGQSVTRAVLKHMSSDTHTIHAVFRAHQQGEPAMRARILNTDGLSHPDDTGIGKLWIENSIHKKTPKLLENIAAITFSVAPDTGYGYPIHAFGLLHVGDTFNKWHLEAIRLPYRN